MLFALQLTPSASHAQTPTPTCTPTPTPAQTPTATPIINCNNCGEQDYPPRIPTITPIPSPYQPSPSRPTVLQWRIYTPAPPPTTALPGVVVVHGGGFRTQSPFHGLTDTVATDIANAGYYVVSIDHDLAPCELIHNQTCHNSTADPGGASGRPPQQTDDVENAVRALRADTTHCNGKIGIVGASSGGSHAVFVSINKTPTQGDAWPHWFKDGHDDRPDCAASLSGAYDFSDRTPESYGMDPDPLPQFNHNIENYTNSQILSYQKSVSPVALTIDSSSFKPLLLINSAHDTMPYHQIVDMICALQAASVAETKYRTITIPNSAEHAFEYWNSWDGISPGPTVLVKGDVLSFLAVYLKDCDGCP